MERFHGQCAYCEESAGHGEVEHFRPKSRFPRLTYEWSNWLLACHDCNNTKREKWPPRGYVDPCASSRSARPERFFDFDVPTGQIIPMAGLTAIRRRKALNTIDDLGLNELHHLKSRLGRIAIASIFLSVLEDGGRPDVERALAGMIDRSSRFSSVVRKVLAERDYSLGDFAPPASSHSR